jgi:hypothetical protein
VAISRFLKCAQKAPPVYKIGVQRHISAFSIAEVGPRNRGSSPVGSEVAIRERITSAAAFFARRENKLLRPHGYSSPQTAL